MRKKTKKTKKKTKGGYSAVCGGVVRGKVFETETRGAPLQKNTVAKKLREESA